MLVWKFVVIIRPPRPASLCTCPISKVVTTRSGDLEIGRATGFLYRGPSGVTWLVTNWHVLTGRRPDNPGELLPGYPQSPDRIRVVFPLKQKGAFTAPRELSLYEDGKPVWYEYKRTDGIDLAAIPSSIPEVAAGVAIQDFAESDSRSVEPGVDVIVVGYPLPHSKDSPYPVWKRAMIASEPGFLVLGTAQMLIDTPGTPGMSGSPVFRSSKGFMASRNTKLAFERRERGETTPLELIAAIDPNDLHDETVVLSFLGVYAGSTGNRDLDRLSLGRAFAASFVDLLVKRGEPGTNPFPPVA